MAEGPNAQQWHEQASMQRVFAPQSRQAQMNLARTVGQTHRVAIDTSASDRSKKERIEKHKVGANQIQTESSNTASCA